MFRCHEVCMGELRRGVQNATLKEKQGTQKPVNFAANGKLHKNHRAFSGSVSVMYIMTCILGKRKEFAGTGKFAGLFHHDCPGKVDE